MAQRTPDTHTPTSESHTRLLVRRSDTARRDRQDVYPSGDHAQQHHSGMVGFARPPYHVRMARWDGGEAERQTSLSQGPPILLTPSTLPTWASGSIASWATNPFDPRTADRSRAPSRAAAHRLPAQALERNRLTGSNNRAKRTGCRQAAPYNLRLTQLPFCVPEECSQ
jgi:hypothetical protein